MKALLYRNFDDSHKHCICRKEEGVSYVRKDTSAPSARRVYSNKSDYKLSIFFIRGPCWMMRPNSTIPIDNKWWFFWVGWLWQFLILTKYFLACSSKNRSTIHCEWINVLLSAYVIWIDEFFFKEYKEIEVEQNWERRKEKRKSLNCIKFWGLWSSRGKHRFNIIFRY